MHLNPNPSSSHHAYLLTQPYVCVAEPEYYYTGSVISLQFGKFVGDNYNNGQPANLVKSYINENWGLTKSENTVNVSPVLSFQTALMLFDSCSFLLLHPHRHDTHTTHTHSRKLPNCRRMLVFSAMIATLNPKPPNLSVS